MASHSAISCYLTCQRKWEHKHIRKTQRDPDAEFDPAPLAVGKCFAKILEDFDHAPDIGWDWPDVANKYRIGFALSKFQLAMITAMLMRYVELHKASGLMVIANELMIHNALIGGFIDSVMVEPDWSGYWIVDNKTAAGKRPWVEESIPRDPQLSIYSALRDKIVAQVPSLKGIPFAGIRYRSSLKPGIKFDAKKDADFWDTVKRCTTESYEIVVPASHMAEMETLEEMEDIARELNLHLSTRTGKPLRRNRSGCLAYGRPCEYWSHCYGKIVTHCKRDAIVNTVDTLEAEAETPPANTEWDDFS